MLQFNESIFLKKKYFTMIDVLQGQAAQVTGRQRKAVLRDALNVTNSKNLASENVTLLAKTFAALQP